MGRSPSDENGLKKGPWTPEEDQKLVDYIQKHGLGSWRALPKLAGLNRCGKSCRLRWTNYLRPDIKRGKFSQEEEESIMNLHAILGNKWSAIASHLPGRTDNEIKNFWNTHLKKRLIQMGYDPMTHQPRNDLLANLPNLLALLNLKDLLMNNPLLNEHAMRLQAEAQLTKLQCLQYLLQSSTSLASTNPNYGQYGLNDMEVLNLLNSLAHNKENPILNSSRQDNDPNNQEIGHNIIGSSQPLMSQMLVSCDPPQEVTFTHQPSLIISDQVGQDSSISQFVNQGSNPNNYYPSNSSWLPSTTNNFMESSTVVGGSSSTSTTTTSTKGRYSSYLPEIFFEDPLLPGIIS